MLPLSVSPFANTFNYTLVWWPKWYGGAMARNPRPDQAITDRWSAELARLATITAERRHGLAKAQSDLHHAVRAAFAEGVLVGTMVKATGLSGSRLFQIKFELRDKDQYSSSSNSS